MINFTDKYNFDDGLSFNLVKLLMFDPDLEFSIAQGEDLKELLSLDSFKPNERFTITKKGFFKLI